jgi:methyl-accepting chemotaxis protein
MKQTGIATKIIFLSCGIALILMVVGCVLVVQYEVIMLNSITAKKVDEKENFYLYRLYQEKKALADQLNSQINDLIKLMKSVDVIYAQTFVFQIQSLLMHPMVVAAEFCDTKGHTFLASWKYKNIQVAKSFPDNLQLKQYLVMNRQTDIPSIEMIRLYYTIEKIEKRIQTLKKQDIDELHETREGVYKKLNALFLLQSIGSLFVVALLGATLIFSLRWLILKPIHELMQIARQLKKLDLSVDIKTTTASHELNSLAQALGQLLEGFRKIIADVKENANMLSGSADNMTDIAKQLTSHSEEAESKSNNVADASVQISTNIHTIANSVEQISDNMESVSSTSEYLFNNINSVANAIEELSSSLSHVGERAKNGTKIAEQAVFLAKKAGNTVNSLRHAADEIGGVSEFIQRIAHKTNILSLNATIEAASAGSAGRGFSVVASAIQEFAEQSSRAAKDITDRIASVQKGTYEIENAFKDVSNIIKEMNESSESISFAVIEQTKAVQEIASNALEADERARNINVSIEDLSRTVNDAADNTAQVAMGANDVSTRIQGVSESISFNRQISHQINETAIVLNHLSGNLKCMVDPFKVSHQSKKTTTIRSKK